jgi:rhodanese-related sulfurtransferase
MTISAEKLSRLIGTNMPALIDVRTDEDFADRRLSPRR